MVFNKSETACFFLSQSRPAWCDMARQLTVTDEFPEFFPDLVEDLKAGDVHLVLPVRVAGHALQLLLVHPAAQRHHDHVDPARLGNGGGLKQHVYALVYSVPTWAHGTRQLAQPGGFNMMAACFCEQFTNVTGVVKS